MKKINLLVALATTCALGMNAQTSGMPISGVNFKVEGSVPALNPFWEEDWGDEDKYLPNTYSISIDSDIKIEFTEYNATEMTKELKYHPYIMLQTGSGFAIDGTFYALEGYEEDGNSSMYAFPMKYEENGKVKYRWGNPYMGSFYATPMVCFLKRIDGVALDPVITQQELAENETLAKNIEFYSLDDEPLYFMQESYTTPNSLETVLVSSYPDDKWEEETFAEAYNRGEIRFNFSNIVSFEDETAIGFVEYNMADDLVVEPIILELNVNAEAGWNYMDGFYTVSAIYSQEGISADQIAEITITLFDMKSDKETVSVDPVVLVNNNINVQRLAKRSQKSKISESMITGNDVVNVYTTSGVIVKENISKNEISNLPSGLYIVNGKTIIVR